VKRILVVKLRSLGDVVLAGPCFAALRRAYPAAWITLLTAPPSHELLKATGWANEVFAYGKAALDRQPLLLKWMKEFRMGQELRKRRFDLALDLYGSHRSAGLVRSSGAPVQAGLDIPETRGFYHLRAPAEDRLTVSARELDLRVMRFAGVEQLEEEVWPVPPAADETAGRFFLANGFTDDDLVVAINPFASCVTKEWGAAKWGAVAAELTAVGIKVFFTCAPMERGRLVEIEIAAGSRFPSYSNASLLPLLGLYQRCRAVLSCDSGPHHLAAAVGTPTVTVWGPERPSRWHPYDAGWHPIVIHEVPCRPCGLAVCIERNHMCMVALKPEGVVKELKRLLRDGEPGRKTVKKGKKFDKTA
jgi:ADP-heptose:LPS heptosyltransferase